METLTATAPAGYADALARRTWAAKSWIATGDTYYRGQAIAAHLEATAHPQHRP